MSAATDYAAAYGLPRRRPVVAVKKAKGGRRRGLPNLTGDQLRDVYAFRDMGWSYTLIAKGLMLKRATVAKACQRRAAMQKAGTW